MRIDLQRWQTHKLLSLAFRRPVPGRVEAVASKEAASVLLAATQLLPSSILATSGLHLWRFLTEVETEGAAAVGRALSPEYCRLFYGPHTLPCPPYGSVYLDGGQVMGPSAVEVLSYYRQAGLRITRGWSEPPDHIALELELMARLGSRYSIAIDGGKLEEARRVLEAQRRFLDDHLGCWGRAFADRLRRAARSHLYRFLGEFLPAWLAFDRDLLEAMTTALPEVPV